MSVDDLVCTTMKENGGKCIVTAGKDLPLFAYLSLGMVKGFPYRNVINKQLRIIYQKLLGLPIWKVFSIGMALCKF